MSQDILDRIHAHHLNFVRVVWCDNANIIRAKAIHRHALMQQLHGVGLSAAQQAVPATADAVAPDSGLGPVGEVWLMPDWDTLRPLPYAPRSARVLGDMVQDGAPWPWCPRGFLRRMIAQAQIQDLVIQAAFEPEFYLLQPSQGVPVPADTTPFAASVAMDQHGELIDAIATALEDQGLRIEQYYPESGPGQQEISVHYAPALQAADQHIVFRQTVQAVARQHQHLATFMPKVFDQAAGSGCHLHLSLWQQEKNITPADGHDGQLSPVAQRFVAGLLHHLPALMAITTPSSNSYRRLQPHSWSGAFQCWGYDNREAAIRIPSNASGPSPTHIELKTVDGAANPYLALGAAIAAGLDGIQQQHSLPEPMAVDPGTLPASERPPRLPARLPSAIDALRQNSVLTKALGQPLARTYLAVRQAEWEAMEGLSLAEEVKLLLERY